jgi:hypothetical protein
VVCVIDAAEAARRCAGLPIVADLAAARLVAGPGGLDGIILTDTGAPQARFEQLLASAARHGFVAGSIVAPSLLGISTMPAVESVAESASAGASP